MGRVGARRADRRVAAEAAPLGRDAERDGITRAALPLQREDHLLPQELHAAVVQLLAAPDSVDGLLEASLQLRPDLRVDVAMSAPVAGDLRNASNQPSLAHRVDQVRDGRLLPGLGVLLAIARATWWHPATQGRARGARIRSEAT